MCVGVVVVGVCGVRGWRQRILRNYKRKMLGFLQRVEPFSKVFATNVICPTI